MCHLKHVRVQLKFRIDVCCSFGGKENGLGSLFRKTALVKSLLQTDHMTFLPSIVLLMTVYCSIGRNTLGVEFFEK